MAPFTTDLSFLLGKKKPDRADCPNVLDQKGAVNAHEAFFIFFYYFLVELLPIKMVTFCLKLLPPGTKSTGFFVGFFFGGGSQEEKTIMLFNLWPQRCSVIRSNKTERTV